MSIEDSPLTCYILDLWGNGCSSETVGSVDELGFAALFYGSFDDNEYAEFLSDEDRVELAAYAGAILFTDSQGFNTVEFYESRDELDVNWDTTVADLTYDVEE